MSTEPENQPRKIAIAAACFLLFFVGVLYVIYLIGQGAGSR